MDTKQYPASDPYNAGYDQPGDGTPHLQTCEYMKQAVDLDMVEK